MRWLSTRQMLEVRIAPSQKIACQTTSSIAGVMLVLQYPLQWRIHSVKRRVSAGVFRKGDVCKDIIYHFLSILHMKMTNFPIKRGVPIPRIILNELIKTNQIPCQNSNAKRRKKFRRNEKFKDFFLPLKTTPVLVDVWIAHDGNIVVIEIQYLLKGNIIVQARGG